MEWSYGILGSTHPIFRHLPGRCLYILLEKGPGGSGAAWTDRLFLRRYGGCVHLESADPRHGAVRRGGGMAFLPAVIGFWAGILFLLGLDHLIPHLHQRSQQAEGPRTQLQRSTMMVLAVTLHNIPEGMAVGVVYAGLLSGEGQITVMAALALSLGIAIQNFPEGAIISMPLRAEGMNKAKAFAGGVLSGVVEPVGALLTILAAGLVIPALPYLLSFAAGAMLYVVVEELIPEMSQGKHSNVGTLAFALGFTLMMALDVALG